MSSFREYDYRIKVYTLGGYGNKKYSLTKRRKKRKEEMKGSGSESQKENAVETKRRREWKFLK